MKISSAAVRRAEEYRAMKSNAVLASVAVVLALFLPIGCQKDDAKDDETTGGSESNGGSKATAGEPGETPEGGKDSGSAGNGETPMAGQSSGDAGSGPGDGTVGACSTGTLLLGDPLWDDPNNEEPKPNPDGQDLLADPPIRNEAIAVIGNKLFIETEFELWQADLSDAKPQLTRFAGTEPSGFVNAGVPCEDTQFLVIRDMVATAQGKLVVVDYVGGAIIEISDPGGPNCKSDWVAGTSEKTADPGSAFPLAHGERDGAGNQALFGGESNGAGIHKVAVDPDGVIYTWDEGTGNFKKVDTDAERTVSTVGHISADDNVMGLAFLKGKLYVTGVDGSNDFLLEVDPAAYDEADPGANVKEVFRARDHFEDVPSGNQAITSQITTDGEALIVSSQAGFVWRLDTKGKVLSTLAGSGAYIEFKDFDPTVAHPATEWQLVSPLSNSNGGPWLALGNGKLYWSGGKSLAKHVLQFDCE
jgi:hypothetical protein